MKQIYSDLDDIFDSLDSARNETMALLDRLSPGQLQFASSPDSWCIAEIAEHISLADDRVVRGIKRILSEIGSSETAENGASVWPVSIAKYVEQIEGQKFKSPESSTPRPTATMAMSLERMRNTREELKLLRPEIAARDLSKAALPHPALGPLNGYEWLIFMIRHEERHVRQIQAVMLSSGFPAQ